MIKGPYHNFQMNTETKHDYYEILEVPQNATQQEIAVAYHKAKRTYSAQNPALYTMFDKAEADMLQTMIDEAFAVLGNDTYRNIYEKRRQAKIFDESELSIDSIKAAGLELFGEAPPKKTSEPVLKISYEIDKTFEQEILNQTQWTGEFLKRVREYKNVTVESLNENKNQYVVHPCFRKNGRQQFTGSCICPWLYDSNCPQFEY